MWNILYTVAYDELCDYFYQCGDDIVFKTDGWINDSIQALVTHNDVGIAGPINNNSLILTQALFSRKHMDRFGINKYMNLLARNWAQVKYSNQVFAIGTIVEPGAKSPKGYYSKAKIQTVDGGTGYAVMMAINNMREVYVFDQIKLKWFRWSYSTMSFIELKETPKIRTHNFAGIGTREITADGIKAIEEVYQKTFQL